MPRARWFGILWLSGLTSVLITPAQARNPCDAQRLASIPMRPAEAITGSAFAQRIRSLSGTARDAEIRRELIAGNLPDFLRQLVPISLGAAQVAHSLTVCVLPDYLAVGNDRDFVFVPMGLDAALTVASRFGFELPTPPVVDAIYDESAIKLHPQPLPAGAEMRSTEYFVRHNLLIGAQRAAANAPLGELTAGHKKDLVLTPRLWQMPGRVAIYGWHRAIAFPIQPLSTVHGARYADYSHGVRLVSDVVYVDGRARRFEDVIADPSIASLLSREGPLPHLSQRLASLRFRLELQQRNPR